MDINFYVSSAATEILNNSNLIDSLNKIADSNSSMTPLSWINIIASGILASVAIYQAFQASKSKKLNLDLLEANKKMANENEKLVQKYDEMIQQNQENYYRDRLIKINFRTIIKKENKIIFSFLYSEKYTFNHVDLYKIENQNFIHYSTNLKIIYDHNKIPNNFLTYIANPSDEEKYNINKFLKHNIFMKNQIENQNEIIKKINAKIRKYNSDNEYILIIRDENFSIYIACIKPNEKIHEIIYVRTGDYFIFYE